MHWLKGSPANFCNGKRTSVARRFFLVEIDIFITKNRSVWRSFYQTLNQNCYFTKTYQIGGHLLTLSVAWFSGYRFLKTLGNLNNQISVQWSEVPQHFSKPEHSNFSSVARGSSTLLGTWTSQNSVQWSEVPQHFREPEQSNFGSVARGSSTLLETWTRFKFSSVVRGSSTIFGTWTSQI